MPSIPAGLRLLPLLVLSCLLGALPATAGWKLDDVIGSDTISLTLEHRYRYEGLSDPFQAANNGKEFTDLISLRTLLHGRVKLPSGFSVGAELEDSRTFLDNDVLLNSTHVNPAELLQAYVRYDGDVEGGKLRARAGRITMDVGSRRLVARNRYRNTINGFTGIDLDWKGGDDRDGLNLRAFFTLPVQREPNPQVAANVRRRRGDNDVVFDREDFDNLFWGLFAARDFDGVFGLEQERNESTADVRRDQWRFDFYELLPGGGFEVQTSLRFPESGSSLLRRQNNAKLKGEPIPQRDPGELQERTWQYGAALKVMPRAPAITFENQALRAAGWTLPVSSASVLGLMFGIFFAFAPARVRA